VTALSAAFAIWGLAIAISLVSVWSQPAPPGQLPGLATHIGFDAQGPFRWMAGMIALPILVPLLLRPVARRLAEAMPWARNTALITPLVALWFVLIARVPSWAVIPFGAVIAVCTILRRRDMVFTRRDIVLLPVLLAVVVSLNDIATTLSMERLFVVGALIVFLLRLAITLIPSSLPPALAFVAAPLGLVLQTNFFARDQRYFGWHALAVAVITPFVLRFVLRNARHAMAMLVFVTYPLSLAAYMNAASLQTAEGKPRVSVFEESHSLLPASEMLAGELPYRDIIPPHGLIQDGLLDYLIMKARGATVGNTWKTRLALGLLNGTAMYALTWAMTGSAEAAFLSVLLAALTNWFTPVIRWLPVMVTLALICGAVRLRRRKWLLYAATGTVLCGATSIDFGAYTFLTFLVAVWRFPGDRSKTLRSAAIGIAIGVVPLFSGLAVLGIFDDFVRTTFIELPSLAPVYALTIFQPPEILAKARWFPEVLVGLFDRTGFLYLIWCVAVVFAGTMLIRRPRRRFEPMVLIAVWITIAAISYAERHHLYYAMAAAPFAVAATWFALRRRSALAPAMIVGLIVLAAPTTHLGILAWIRDSRGPVDQGWVEVPEIPRARGALFLHEDAAALRGVQKYVSLALAPGETWLDLTNRGIFYFFLRRDCPIRQPEVAFYETAEGQRQVISRLENDRRIRAVLVPGFTDRYTVDGVPNQQRVPLVWQYIQVHFELDFEEGDVVMWRRK
jgi:hypothetical protein